MIDLKLDTTRHDLAVESFDLQLVDKKDRVAQHLKTRLLFFKGEWFLDTTFGLDYYQFILVKNPDLSVVASVIKATILDTTDVTLLQEYSQEFNTASRELAIKFKVSTTYGDIESTEVL